VAEPFVRATETGAASAEELAALGDRERARWYSEGGGRCVVLTEHGLLLEPVPTFGPLLYRRIAAGVTFAEGERLAAAKGCVHLRRLPSARS
jgi:hypothetical protein